MQCVCTSGIMVLIKYLEAGYNVIMAAGRQFLFVQSVPSILLSVAAPLIYQE